MGETLREKLKNQMCPICGDFVLDAILSLFRAEVEKLKASYYTEYLTAISGKKRSEYIDRDDVLALLKGK